MRAIGKLQRLIGGRVSLNESGEAIRVDFYRTQITDAGLEHLKGLTSLNKLILKETQVTDAGVSKLKAALPKCTVTKY